jgi:hypothetical protein
MIELLGQMARIKPNPTWLDLELKSSNALQHGATLNK